MILFDLSLFFLGLFGVQSPGTTDPFEEFLVFLGLGSGFLLGPAARVSDSPADTSSVVVADIPVD